MKKENKWCPFVFVYTNGYESKEFISSENMTLRGIRISLDSVMSVNVFSANYSANEAATRGLLEKEYENRLCLLDRDEMFRVILRKRELNTMLEACGADFILPFRGVCWAQDGNEVCGLSLIDGLPISGTEGCAIYKYL